MNTLKPIVTEKAVMRIELENVLTFVLGKNETKESIKKAIEEMFNVKVEKVRTLVRENKKFAYVKLKMDFPAIDIATKLGLI
ncbi:MAG: 50S ribosomal protein L23 [Candidatus Pacearchaeota archaeon]|jgi:large subunit ribosomal protein L23